MLDKLFSKKKKEELKHSEVRIALPKESHTLIEYKQDDLPCIAVVNSGLFDLKHEDIFRWHLSVIIDFRELGENGMPTEEEQAIVDPFCDQLNEEIKARGNALFLVRETWNKPRRLAWMVYNPEIAHQNLQYIIEHHEHPRAFDYRMEEEIGWVQAKLYLSAIKT